MSDRGKKKKLSKKEREEQARLEEEAEAQRLRDEEEAARQYELTSKGAGSFEFPDGSKYEGGWKIERATGLKKRHGFGKFWAGDEEYEGDWDMGVLSGKGRYRFATGAWYDGEWANSRFHGRGTYSWPSGASYIGDWVDNRMHGQGCFTTDDGDRFQGAFKADKFLNEEGFWVAPAPTVTLTRAILARS